MRKPAVWTAIIIALMVLAGMPGPTLAQTQTQSIVTDLEQRAAAGDGEAALTLAGSYAEGKGVPPDQTKADQYYRRALDLGQPFAAYYMARRVIDRDPPAAYDLLKRFRQAFDADPHANGLAKANYLMLLGNAALDTGRLEDALALSQEQLDRSTEFFGGVNVGNQARIKSNMANVLFAMGKPEAAEQQLTEALAMYTRAYGAKDVDVLNIYNNLAIAEEELSKFDAAVANYRKALAIAQRVYPAGSIEVAIQKSNLGSALDRVGKSAEAEVLYRDALAVIGKAEGQNSRRYGIVLADMGTILVSEGKYAEALATERTALAIVEQQIGLKNRYVAATHYAIANILNILGKPQESLPEFQIAYAMYGELYGIDNVRTATVRADMASATFDAGRIDDAISEYKAALQALEKVLGPTADRVQFIHNNLALVYARQKNFDAAIAEQEQSNAIAARVQGPASVEYATGLVNKASFLIRKGDIDAALPLLVQAMPIYAGARSQAPDSVRKLYLNLADALNKTQRPRAARLFAKLAINAQERLRGLNAGLTEQLGRSLAISLQPAYNLLVEQQIADGAFSEAQFVGGLPKSVELAGLTGDGRSIDAVPLTRSEQALLNAVAVAVKPAAQIGDKLQALFLAPQKNAATMDKLSADYAAKAAALQTALAALFAGAEADHAKWEADLLSQNDAQAAALQKQLAAIGPKVVLYQAVSTDTALHLFVSWAGHETVHREVAISRADLASAVFDAVNAIERRSPDGDQRLTALYDKLMAPVADDLRQSGASVMMLDLAGFLRYVPYAALRHDGYYLVERYALALYNPAAHTRFAAPGAAAPTAAGFGVTTAHGEFPPLPGVGQELSGVFAGPGGGALIGVPLLDGAFTEASLRQGLAAHPRYVHIASHFKFEPGRENDSFLLLGDGGELSLAAFRKDRALQFKGVDLLTLSACETARGGGSEGEEVESFGALAQTNGAAAVMATLWPIADESTAKLMADFYDGRVRLDLDKATALQRAQIAMLRGIPVARVVSRGGRGVTSVDDTGGADGPSASTSQPYYWAAFILMGNWL